LSAEEAQPVIGNAPSGQRDSLLPVLDASFTGLYLRHSRRTLVDVETVLVARLEDRPVGLVMLKLLSKEAGYVYYIAVLPSHRGKGIGRRLVTDSLAHFSRAGAGEVYATVGEDNEESNALFRGQGFRRTDFGEVSRKYGAIRALAMYRGMWVVPGELILVKDAAPLPAAPPPATG
jgi:ribosomal protein S18 acetylase RimI-like enzyme